MTLIRWIQLKKLKDMPHYLKMRIMIMLGKMRIIRSSYLLSLVSVLNYLDFEFQVTFNFFFCFSAAIMQLCTMFY